MKKQRATKGRRQRRRQTKRNYKRGGAPFHGSVDDFLQLASQKRREPLDFFASNYARENNDDFLFELVKRVIREVKRVAYDGQMDEETVVDVVSTLLIHGSKFNRSIIRLLLAVKPIKDMRLLNQLYEDVIDNLNAHVLNVMRYAGHVPLTERHKRQLAETYSLRGATTPEFDRIFREIVPSAQTETTHAIYSLGQREIGLPADDVIELHSYLDAAADDSFNRQMRSYIEEMDAEEAAYNAAHEGDGDFEGDGDY